MTKKRYLEFQHQNKNNLESNVWARVAQLYSP